MSPLNLVDLVVAVEVSRSMVRTKCHRMISCLSIRVLMCLVRVGLVLAVVDKAIILKLAFIPVPGVAVVVVVVFRNGRGHLFFIPGKSSTVTGLVIMIKKQYSHPLSSLYVRLQYSYGYTMIKSYFNWPAS